MRLAPNPLAFHIACAMLGAAALGTASPAWADAAAQPAEAAADKAQLDSASRQADADEAVELGAVQVTAQSRKQSLQDVPIAVQVVNEQQIDMHAATDLSEMDAFIPGLVIYATQPTQPTYQLRGIGGSGFGIGTDPAVGVYVDGVYSARTGAALLPFNDIKRIEVLKGPQGTLFGRNAAAGAISVITNRPAPWFEANARLRVGHHGTRQGSAMLNIPVSDGMALRFNVFDRQGGAWVQDAASGRHYGGDGDWGARVAWGWTTGSNDIWLTLTHERLEQAPRPAFGLIPLTADNDQRPPFPPNPAAYLDPRSAPLLNDPVGGLETRRYDNATVHFDHYTDWGQITSITAWTQFDTFNRADFDGTNHIVSHLDETNIESNESFYQEIKLSGQNTLMNWVAGTSWYKEDGHQASQVGVYTDTIDTLIKNLGIPTGTPDGTLYHYFNQVLQMYGLPFSVLGEHWREQMLNRGSFKSYAVYGDIIWHLSDTLDLTTGARFTRDSKDFRWYNMPRSAPGLDQTIDALEAMGLLAQAGINPAVFRQNLILTGAVGIPVEASESWTDFSPRVVLSKHFSDRVMAYGSVAKGYKAGGFNILQVNSRYEPEEVWNYEVGVKTVFPEQHLVLNASVYHYRYSNLQAMRLDPNTSGSGIPHYVVDSSDQVADGLDVALVWEPLESLRVNFTGAWIDSRYGNKISATGADLTGEPTGVPKLSAALGLQYAWHIHGGELAFNVQHAWRGESRCNQASIFQGSCQASPNFKVGQAMQRTDVRLDWRAPGDHWGVAVYANNLFDNRYVLGVNNTGTQVFGTPFASITPPRMYGVELRVQY